jgi:deazaflavin-dependent oxidoreductase (nitroreductase family)
VYLRAPHVAAEPQRVTTRVRGEADYDRPVDVRAAAEKEASKHRRLFKSARDGARLSAAMLPFVMTLPPRGYGVLTTIGRKTGKMRRKCIRVIRKQNMAYLVQLRPPEVAIRDPSAVAAWVQNLRANPTVYLRIRGGTFPGAARELTEPGELAKAREAICETVVPVDYAECSLHLRGVPTRTKIKELHRYWFDTGVPLVIELRG